MNMDIVSKVGKELYRSKTSSRRHQIIKKGKYHGFGSSRSGVVSGENLSSENNFSEDYIVFRIREDGAIDVVEDEQEVSSHLHQVGEYKKSIKGKLDFAGKSAEPNLQLGHHVEEGRANKDSNDVMCLDVVDKGDHSDDSFSFPELGCDWIGSPVKMPRPVERKIPTLCLRFRCFKV